MYRLPKEVELSLLSWYFSKPIYSTRSISMHGFRYVFCISSEMDNCRQGLQLKVDKYVFLQISNHLLRPRIWLQLSLLSQ